MAETKSRRGEPKAPGRRRFMAACGVVTAAAALPGGTARAGAPASWPRAVGQGVRALRAAYQAEVQRLAEELRPRFESGELHGWGLDDDADGGDHPASLLEEELEEELGSLSEAYLILACSPSEEGIDGGMPLADARSAAAECLVLDVYRFARRRGWWKPRRGEYVGPDEWRARRDERRATP